MQGVQLRGGALGLRACPPPPPGPCHVAGRGRCGRATAARPPGACPHPRVRGSDGTGGACDAGPGVPPSGSEGHATGGGAGPIMGVGLRTAAKSDPRPGGAARPSAATAKATARRRGAAPAAEGRARPGRAQQRRGGTGLPCAAGPACAPQGARRRTAGGVKRKGERLVPDGAFREPRPPAVADGVPGPGPRRAPQVPAHPQGAPENRPPLRRRLLAGGAGFQQGGASRPHGLRCLAEA